MLFKLLTYIVVFSVVFYGIRKIITDWRDKFNHDDAQKHQRDLKERDQDNVIDLKADDEGIFRPKDENDKKND